MKKASLVAVAVVLALSLTISAPPAGAIVSVAGPGGFITGYASPVAVVPAGQSLTFTNADIEAHDIQALDAVREAGDAEWCIFFGDGECPLFWSPTAGLGESVEVKGVSDIPSGAIYEFYCSLHPWMTGKLVVQ